LIQWVIADLVKATFCQKFGQLTLADYDFGFLSIFSYLQMADSFLIESIY
jgi:hypothetical protein